MKQWEYFISDVRNTNSTLVEEWLNNHGNAGWELVTVDKELAYLKREVNVDEMPETDV